MIRGQAVICERMGVWVAAFRRHAAATASRAGPLPVCQTGSLHDVQEILERWPASLLAVEVTEERAGQVLERLPALARRFPAMRWAGLDATGGKEMACRSSGDALTGREVGGGTEDGERHEVLSRALREAGAIHVARSPRDLGLLVTLAKRHLTPDRSPGDRSSSVPPPHTADAPPRDPRRLPVLPLPWMTDAVSKQLDVILSLFGTPDPAVGWAGKSGDPCEGITRHER